MSDNETTAKTPAPPPALCPTAAGVLPERLFTRVSTLVRMVMQVGFVSFSGAVVGQMNQCSGKWLSYSFQMTQGLHDPFNTVCAQTTIIVLYTGTAATQTAVLLTALVAHIADDRLMTAHRMNQVYTLTVMLGIAVLLVISMPAYVEKCSNGVSATAPGNIHASAALTLIFLQLLSLYTLYRCCVVARNSSDDIQNFDKIAGRLRKLTTLIGPFIFVSFLLEYALTLSSTSVLERNGEIVERNIAVYELLFFGLTMAVLSLWYGVMCDMNIVSCRI